MSQAQQSTEHNDDAKRTCVRSVEVCIALHKSHHITPSQIHEAERKTPTISRSQRIVACTDAHLRRPKNRRMVLRQLVVQSDEQLQMMPQYC
jgi:hypothetical protein